MDMRIENLIELRDKLSQMHGYVNFMVSHQSMELIELAYPNEDGVQDAEVISEMYLLRSNAKALSIACDKLVDQLSCLIGDIDQYE